MKGITHLVLGIFSLLIAFAEMFMFPTIITHPYMILLIFSLCCFGGFNIGMGIGKINKGR